MGAGKSNLVLIGFPASGKSTLGQALAKETGRKFIDTDALIEEQTGRTLQEIIDAEGNEKFLEVEQAVICGLDTEHAVIATGGSVPYSKTAMAHLEEKGEIVFLWISPETVEERLQNLGTRGVVLPEGWSLRDLYDYRQALYDDACHIRVNVNGLSIRESTEKVLQAVRDTH